MPLAIENVKGIIIIIIRVGSNSVKSDQSSFSIPLSINIAAYIRAPAVAYAGTIAASEKKIATKNNAPTNIAVKPVLPPASTPAELST